MGLSLDLLELSIVGTKVLWANSHHDIPQKEAKLRQRKGSLHERPWRFRGLAYKRGWSKGSLVAHALFLDSLCLCHAVASALPSGVVISC